MFSYYFTLALRSLKRNVVLTLLMIAAIGVGIGASMTTLTVFRAMAGDPIPEKSTQLFSVQIDNWGPSKKTVVTGDEEHLQPQISYPDAIGLMNAHAAPRQSAMYATGFALTPSNPQLLPFQVHARAAYTDVFRMFDVPFRFGGPWSSADDDNRVVGVMDQWQPIPKFYDLNNDKYGKSEQLFLPFTRAIAGEMSSWGNNNCAGDIGAPGWQGRLHSECIWIQFWAELPTTAD